MKVTAHADRYTYLTVSHSLLLAMRNVSDKICTGNQIHILCYINFFFSKTGISGHCHRDIGALSSGYLGTATGISGHCHRDNGALPPGYRGTATGVSGHCHRDIWAVQPGYQGTATGISGHCHRDIWALPPGYRDTFRLP
jgi:hypothetical protein